MTDVERQLQEVPPAATPLADMIARPRRSSGRGTTILFVLAAAIAIGGLAFAAGRLTAPAAAGSNGRTFGQLPVNGSGRVPGDGQAFAGRDGFGGITLRGTVTAISADSITLRLASGTDVAVPLGSSTTYHRAASATSDAVTVGSEVSVTPGARTADGAAPGASGAPNPDASPGAFPRLSFGPASDVTVIEK